MSDADLASRLEEIERRVYTLELSRARNALDDLNERRIKRPARWQGYRFNDLEIYEVADGTLELARVIAPCSAEAIQTITFAQAREVQEWLTWWINDYEDRVSASTIGVKRSASTA